MSCAAGGASGALLGWLLGGDSKGKWAAIGGAAGVAAGCATAALLDHHDRQRIRDAQIQSLEEDTTVTETWEGEDGTTRIVKVGPTPEPVDVPEAPGQLCRKVAGDVSVGEESEGALPEEIYCRTPEGGLGPHGRTSMSVRPLSSHGSTDVLLMWRRRGSESSA